MKIRKMLPGDRVLLAGMILRDPDHQARGVEPDFFFAHQLCMCFEDDKGPVFFARLDVEIGANYHPIPSIRLHTQFDSDIPLRTARTLAAGFEVVKDRCRLADVERLVFDSIDGRLRDFCINRLGFKPVAGTADLEMAL